MSTLAFDTHKFVKELTGAGMKTEQAEVLASSYAGLLTDRIAYAQVAAALALSAVIVLVAFLGD